MKLRKLNKQAITSILQKASKTFAQAFFSSIVIENFYAIRDIETLKLMLKTTALAGIAAGVSAVWNMLLEMRKVW